MVFCDNTKCKHNDGQVCACNRVVFMDGKCVTEKKEEQ